MFNRKPSCFGPTHHAVSVCRSTSTPRGDSGGHTRSGSRSDAVRGFLSGLLGLLSGTFLAVRLRLRCCYGVLIFLAHTLCLHLRQNTPISSQNGP